MSKIQPDLYIEIDSILINVLKTGPDQPVGWFNRRPVACPVRFTLLNCFTIEPVTNRLNQRSDRWPGGRLNRSWTAWTNDRIGDPVEPDGSKRTERFKLTSSFWKNGRVPLDKMPSDASSVSGSFVFIEDRFLIRCEIANIISMKKK